MMRFQPCDLLVDRANSNPNGLFLDAYDTEVSNQQAFDFVQRCAFFLRSIGVRPGHVVALNLPIPLHILFMLATWHECAISAAYSPSVASQNHWKPEWLVATSEYAHDSARNFIRVDEALLTQIETGPPAAHFGSYPSGDDVCRILFSSGTTGTPKGVPFTLSMLELRAERSSSSWLSTDPFISLFDIGALGGFIAFFAQLKAGQGYYVPGTPAHNASQVFKHGARHVQGSPLQIAALLDRIRQDGYTISTVKEVSIAGSVISPRLASRIRDELGAEVYNIYGSTEGGAVTYRNYDCENPFEAGPVFSDVEIEIVDEQHRPLPPNQVGRIKTRSKFQASGYFRDPESSLKFFKDGWYFPGDWGYLTDERKLVLEGRDSELINIGGVKVDPSKIDNEALSLDGVKDAAAFPYLDANGLKGLALAVVPGEAYDQEKVKSHLEGFFGFGAPSRYVVTEAIPRNDRGKVMRGLLESTFG